MYGAVFHPEGGPGGGVAAGGTSPFDECRLNAPSLRQNSGLGEVLEHWREVERDVAGYFVSRGWMDFQGLSIKGAELTQEVRSALDRVSRDIRLVFNHFATNVLGTSQVSSDRLERRLQTIHGLLRERIPADLQVIERSAPQDGADAEAARLLESARVGLRVLDSEITKDVSGRIESAKEREALEVKQKELSRAIGGIVEAHNESVERIIITALRPVENVDSIAKLIQSKLKAADDLARSLSNFPDQEVAHEARQGAERTRERYESLSRFLSGITIQLPGGEMLWDSETLFAVTKRLDEVRERMASNDLRALVADAGSATTLKDQLVSELESNRDLLGERVGHLREIEEKLKAIEERRNNEND